MIRIFYCDYEKFKKCSSWDSNFKIFKKIKFYFESYEMIYLMLPYNYNPKISFNQSNRLYNIINIM